MRLIEQSVEYWGLCPSGYGETVSRVEAAARTCFTPDTEVLTDKGWAPIGSINPEDHVLTYNVDSNKLEYQVSNVFGKFYDGDLVIAEHRLCKLAVTPDHRVYCKIYNRRIKKSKFEFVPAENLKTGNNGMGFIIPRKFEGATLHREEAGIQIIMPDKKHFSGKPLVERVVKGKNFSLNNDFLTIIAAYISDGHLLDGNRGVCVTKSKGSILLKRVTDAAANMGWSCREGKSAGRDHIRSLVVTGGSPIGDWFEANCGRGSLNKKLPDFWRSLSLRQMRTLWEVLVLGDGHVSKEGRTSYRSSSHTLIEQLSELLTLLGDNCTICESNTHPEKRTWTKNTHYTLYVSKRPHLVLLPEQITLQHYRGDVFCTQTGNGIICVRVGGKIVWTGNCYRSEPSGDPEKFINTRLLKPNPPHFSVLEHSNVVGFLRHPQYHTAMKLAHKFKSRWVNIEFSADDNLFIYGNLRAWMEVLDTRDMQHALKTIEGHGLTILPPEQQPRHMQRVTVKLTTDRAVLAEITRHRNDVGFSVQSQRYVDYVGEVCYIKPSWYDSTDNEQARQAFWTSCFDNEFQYKRLRSYSLAPQDARVVLNNQTATVIVMTAYLPQWDWMFKLRKAPAAYPQMRNLMTSVYDYFSAEGLV